MQISSNSRAKDSKEFNLWVNHQEICLQTVKILCPQPDLLWQPRHLGPSLLQSPIRACVTGSKAKFQHF